MPQQEERKTKGLVCTQSRIRLDVCVCMCVCRLHEDVKPNAQHAYDYSTKVLNLINIFIEIS